MIVDLEDLRERVEIWLDQTRERLEFILVGARYWICGLVCRVVGHAERIPGDWPEDHVCPRCGDLYVDAGFTISVERPEQDFHRTTDDGRS